MTCLTARASVLLDCARRLDLALNTVKRYARAREARAAAARPAVAGPRSSIPTATTCASAAPRTRRCPSQQLLREIRELGYQGSSNLLVPARYINQRLDGDRPHLSPRQAARILLTRPDGLAGQPAGDAQQALRAACPEMTALARPRPLIRRAAGPGPGQRRQSPAVDHRRARRRPAPRALL